MGRHRKSIEDSDDVTDIIAVEVPLDPPKPKAKPKAPVRPPPWDRTISKAASKPAVKSGFDPLFKGFDRTAPQPKTEQPAAGKPDPPDTPAVIRRRISIVVLSAGLGLTSFALMLWALAAQPTCPKAPPLRPPITITVPPTPPTLIPHHY